MQFQSKSQQIFLIEFHVLTKMYMVMLSAEKGLGTLEQVQGGRTSPTRYQNML